ELQEAVKEEEDDEKDLVPRPPIVTVMGHVDHGKTKLLDYIRRTNVIAGEAGGITQHIGAYSVKLDDGRQITFLDTPGHEAFTAMRARGAQITDVAIIVVAADDGVMPQTVEAINHASAAGVPIVFAINKIDKPTANPDKIKEELAAMNYLVEDWGGKYQSQEISAKAGLHVEDLLDKVLLEAEMLDLKANPNKPAVGTILESSLDKGRGYVATVLVRAGTLKIGDMMLAGSCYGHIKAMYNERGNKITEVGPATPALVLGLNGAPQAGDKFNVMELEHEAKEIANKRAQLQREQGLRTQKHITLEEIGRRIAIGNFQELNIVVKGDVDGSVEALSDSLIKLSTPEIELNIIHKAVGQISESDVLLAAASNAVIVGFQVRPSIGARKLAEKEQIDIRLYSIIYTAIEEIKSAMEGMLSPEEKEEVTATLEVRETFKVGKVGTVAGCYVKEGKITRNTKIRVIRDGIVVYTGELDSLKRFKDDVKEVVGGFECGLNVHNFNDLKIGDIIEGYKIVERKKTL
ncbi:MAG: translation initiation factor IF-2, partial [Bacteroidales bacterium]|nr:translation initiation factor IF-2 [Bacteroidales bacterium]